MYEINYFYILKSTKIKHLFVRNLIMQQLVYMRSVYKGHSNGIGIAVGLRNGL